MSDRERFDRFLAAALQGLLAHDGGPRGHLWDEAERVKQIRKDVALACDYAAAAMDATLNPEAPPPAPDDRAELLAALERCELAMETAGIHGVRSLLLPAYHDSWAEAHEAARAVIRRAKREG